MPLRRDGDDAAGRDADRFGNLVRACGEGRLSRRELLARAAVLGPTGSTLGTLLAACGDAKGAGSAPVTMDTTLPQQITLFNWEFYAAPKVLKDFETRHGVKVVDETFGSQDELYKVMQKDSGGLDVIMASDFAAGTVAEDLGAFNASFDKAYASVAAA
jgi:spermidine/putrescine-binding protein